LGRVKERLAGGIPKARKAAGDPGLRLDSAFWAGEDEELLAVLLPLLKEAAGEGAGTLAAMVEAEYGLAIDWSLPNAEAVEWAGRYAAELVKGINGTTGEALKRSISSWLDTPGATMGDLYEELGGLYPFGESRARMIAVTEVTRAYAEGNLAGARGIEAEGLFEWRKKWQTNNDELVCSLCAPMHGQTARGTDGEEWTEAGLSVASPPMHPRCRCWLTFEPVFGEEGVGSRE